MGKGKRGRDSHGRVMEICSLLSRQMFCLVHRVQELLVSMVSVDMALPMTQNLTCLLSEDHMVFVLTFSTLQCYRAQQ